MSLESALRERLDTSRALAIPIKELTEVDRGLFLRHLLRLSPEDRYLRFGSPVSDFAIEHYVEGMDFVRSTVFGIFDENLELAAAGHFATVDAPGIEFPGRAGAGACAEFGLSVAEQARGRGLGTALFVRAAIHARNLGIATLFIHCLLQNKAMMRIARRAGMAIVQASGEVDAYVTLAPADSSSVIRELLQQQTAVFDFAFKEQLLHSRRLLGNATARDPKPA